MSEVMLFRRADQDLAPAEDTRAAVLALVNAGNSDTMGAGIGVFDAGSDIQWTVTYDEVLFIHDGDFRLKVGDAVYHAGPGDTLWIPANTPLAYQADSPVTFFYAVYPAHNSPSAGQPHDYPTAPPDKA